MSLAPVLALFLKGNLKDGKIISKFPINQFQKGVWQIAIDSLSYQFENNHNELQYICSLKCNWISYVTYNDRNELLTESPFIYQFHLSKTRDTIINNKTFYEINSLSEFLECDIFDLSTNSVLKTNCFIYIIFHIQRKV